VNIKVSVIIPTYKDWGRLRLCLQALEKQDLDEIKLEVLVINNDPESLIPSDIQKNTNIKILTESKPGSYAARNKGVKESSGDILAFTDADCIPDKQWIRRAVENLNSDSSGYTRIGGRVQLTFPDKKTVFDEYERLFSFRQKEFCDVFGYSVTANMICLQSCFEKVGLFRDDLLSGGDTEWGKRAEAIGEKIIYCDDVVVCHPSRSSFKELNKKLKRVSGGVYSRNCQSLKSKILIVLKSAIPPVGSVRSICKYSDFGGGRKIVLIMLSCYFKFSRFLLFLLLMMGVVKPNRQ